MSGSWVLQRLLVNLGLWADTQEDGPLAGSHLLTFTNGGCCRSGRHGEPHPWEKNAEGPPQRTKKQWKLPLSVSLKRQALHRERLKVFWSWFSMLYYPTFFILSPCFCMILIGKPNMEDPCGPKSGNGVRQGRRSGSHQQLVSGGTETNVSYIVSNSSFRKRQSQIGGFQKEKASGRRCSWPQTGLWKSDQSQSSRKHHVTRSCMSF